MDVDDLAHALAEHGLILRGGFHPEPGEAGLEDAGTVLMVGNAGPAMWAAFSPHMDGRRDPLNRWTTRVIGPIAARIGARAVYPFGSPQWPFQRWAQRAEGVFRSPLGLLIHPRYGLWHAYRAALLVPQHLKLPATEVGGSPCSACIDKPCLSACPVGAFAGEAYDVPACATHLRGGGAACPATGCHSRNACPAGAEWRYPDEQLRFHMSAFALSVATG